MNNKFQNLEERGQYLKEKAKEVRVNIIDMIFTSQSGHLGGSLSCTDILTALYFEIMKIDPKNPKEPFRDCFILSKERACPAWYACLSMKKGFFELSHLDTLRKFGSILQGHPDMKKTPWIDMTTGSLGHGASAALGMALEGKILGATYRVFCILGDGELNEGIVWEAGMCAAKYQLENLVFIVDRNHLQAIEAAKELEKSGISAEVIDAYSVKPVDWQTIKKSVDKTGILFVAENHQIRNGLGYELAYLIALEGHRVSFTSLGLDDTFAETGEYLELLRAYGLSSASITAAAKRLIK